MSNRFGRRKFLKKSVGAAVLAAGASVMRMPAVLAERAPNSKLNTVVIGANGQGMAHVPVAASEHLVALVDIDDGRMAKTLDWLDKNHPGVRSKVKTYYDYRKMFDEMHKQIDAVFIAIPDPGHPRGLSAGRQGGRRSAQLQLPRCLRTLPRGPAGR